MRVFVTGATGFVGSRVVDELLAAGHQVLGLTRSDAGAEALAKVGADVHRGTLEEPQTLRQGAALCDAVIHTAFDHDFSRFMENCEKDMRVIAAMGEALQGSSRPLIITSAVPMGTPAPGEPAREDVFDDNQHHPRAASERAGQLLLDKGIDVRVMRLAQIHDRVKQGLVTMYIGLSLEKGEVAYVGAGDNCWSAAHVQDTARLYRLVLEGGEAGKRYHASAEGRIASRAIAEILSKRLELPLRQLTPEVAGDYFGWFKAFVELDMSADSQQTRDALGWQPTGPGLLEDLGNLDLEQFAQATA